MPEQAQFQIGQEVIKVSYTPPAEWLHRFPLLSRVPPGTRGRVLNPQAGACIAVEWLSPSPPGTEYISNDTNVFPEEIASVSLTPFDHLARELLTPAKEQPKKRKRRPKRGYSTEQYRVGDQIIKVSPPSKLPHNYNRASLSHIKVGTPGQILGVNKNVDLLVIAWASCSPDLPVGSEADRVQDNEVWPCEISLPRLHSPFDNLARELLAQEEDD